MRSCEILSEISDSTLTCNYPVYCTNIYVMQPDITACAPCNYILYKCSIAITVKLHIKVHIQMITDQLRRQFQQPFVQYHLKMYIHSPKSGLADVYTLCLQLFKRGLGEQPCPWITVCSARFVNVCSCVCRHLTEPQCCRPILYMAYT